MTLISWCPVHHSLRVSTMKGLVYSVYPTTGTVVSFSHRVLKPFDTNVPLCCKWLEEFLDSLIHGGIHSPTGVGVLLSL